MEMDSDDVPDQSDVVVRRDSTITEDFLKDFSNYCVRNEKHDHDMEFICADGTVPFYQSILSAHSEYLYGMLGRFHSVEFSIGDWQFGEMFLLDRRKSGDLVSISVPDLDTRHVRLMLDLFYFGTVSLATSEDAKILRELWKLFKIDSMRLDSLEVISEVNLLKSGSKSVKNNAAQNHFIKLQNIKKEITEENDDFQTFRSGLEIECELCRETFQAEDDLMRHVDYIHQASKSMYDRIKYKRAKEKDEAHHPKGKGKGKKSIESKPVRKELAPQTRCLTPTVVDNSNSNSYDDGLMVEDEIHISDNEITFKTSFEEDNNGNDEGSRDSSESSDESGKGNKRRITLEKKRKYSGDSGKVKISDVEPELKKTKVNSVSREHSPSPPPSSNNDSEVDDKDPDLSWEDIVCLYCDQSIQIHRDKPGQNKKKYQQHLLSHFSDTQYADVPDGVRMYQCGYRDCGYCSGHKNHYLQHIAFKHDEWYKRINRRIEEAMRDPQVAEELEDLSAVKEAFVTDYRIMPLAKGSASVKPLWVDGTLVGRDAENEAVKEPEVDSPVPEPMARLTEKEAEIKVDEVKEKKVKDSPLLQCQFCPKIMKTDSSNIMKNRNSYQIHLVESHFESWMYDDISDDNTEYRCPHSDCDFVSPDKKSRLRIHLTIFHQEFYPRIFKRIESFIPKSGDAASDDKKPKEAEKLKEVIKFFRSDSRVLDDTIPDEKDIKEVDLTLVKKEKDMPDVKVEISEEFSQYLKDGTIKKEPEDGTKATNDENQEDKSKDNSSPPEEEKKKTKKKSKKLKSKEKGKKSKKEIKHKNLRKQQEQKEITIKIEDDEDDSGSSSHQDDVKNVDEEPVEKASESVDIIKLHEDIVNSQEITLEDDEIMEITDGKNESESVRNEVTLDDNKKVTSCEVKDKKCEDLPVEEIVLDDEEKESVEPKDEATKVPNTVVEDKAKNIESKHDENAETSTKLHDSKNQKSIPDVAAVKQVSKKGLEFSCRACGEEYEKRPGVIMHIITEHIQDKFGELPDMVDGKFHCPHDKCSYTTAKKNGLLAHLTLKHTAVKISEVTDLIDHNENALDVGAAEPAQPPISDKVPEQKTEETKSEERDDKDIVKKEQVDQPLSVHIQADDAADISWKCKVCKKHHDTEEAAKQHVLLFHLLDRFEQLAPKDKKIFTCDQCFKYSTVTRISFIKHLGLSHQAVPDEVFTEHIEQCKTLLLDIDVVKCKCEKKFEGEKQLRHHIIFTHFKQKFKHIPKGLSSYKCGDYYPGCSMVTESRVALIKHSVTGHKSVSEQDFARYMSPEECESPAQNLDDVEEISCVESVEKDDSSIGFDDSVSQAANPQARNDQEAPTIIDIEADKGMEGVPFDNNSSHNCPICFKVIAQRSNFEDHLQTHGVNTEPVFQCLSCDLVTSCGQLYCHLAAHHGAEAAAVRCLACEAEVRGHTARECFTQLRDQCFSKERRRGHQQRADIFMGNLENNLYTKFRYSCQTCSMYFMTFEDLQNHKAHNSRCSQINHGTRLDPVYQASSLFTHHVSMTQHQHQVSTEAGTSKAKYGLSYRQSFYHCGSCSLASSHDNILSHIKESGGRCTVMMCAACNVNIASDPRAHVLSDNHVKNVAKFPGSDRYKSHILKFKYCCDSCSFSFTTFNNLTGHSNCPKLKFRCVPCNHSCHASEFANHLRSAGHSAKMASMTEPGGESREGDTVAISSAADTNSNFKQPGQPRPSGRPPSPADDSIIEISPSEPEPSIMEVESVASVPSTSSMRPPLNMTNNVLRPPPPVAVAGPSGVRGHIQPQSRLQQQQQPRRPPPHPRQQPGKTFMYCCEACKKKFSDAGKFQSHSVWHDSSSGGGETRVKMICLACSWSVQDTRVSAAVTQHLFSDRHAFNLAQKMSPH